MLHPIGLPDMPHRARTPGQQIVYVLCSDFILDKGTQERWEVSWNTGCYPRRVSENRYHPILWAAVEAA